jgi:hypothetical protein
VTLQTQEREGEEKGKEKVGRGGETEKMKGRITAIAATTKTAVQRNTPTKQQDTNHTHAHTRFRKR